MSEKIRYAESIRRLAVLLQDMTGAADELEAMGSLEQSRDQAENAAKAAQEKLAEVNSELLKANDSLIDANAKVLDLIQGSFARAAEIEAEAANKAKAMVDEATDQVNALISDAQRNITTETEELRNKLVSMNSEVKRVMEELTGLGVKQFGAQAELDSLNQKIADVKSVMAEMLAK